MAKKIVKIWYDKEGDYLEVMFDKKAGFFRETKNDHIMQKVDQAGHVLGFAIMGVKDSARKPLQIALSLT